MSSAIDPERKPKPAAATPGKPQAAAPQKPVPPPTTAKPAARPAAPAAAATTDAAETVPAESGPSVVRGLFKQTPAWAVSLLVHVVALLGMALVVNPPPEKEKPRLITSAAPEVEDSFEEFEDDMLEDTPVEAADPTADVVVAADVTVVEDVQVVADATDVDAAPLAVELTDFGSETAPASDLLSTIGAVGGTAGGFGGRAAASKMAMAGGGGKDTEDAVDAALKWFIAHQMPDGGWSFDLTQCPSCQGRCKPSGNKTHAADRCAATAMALLPFLGRGYTHKEGPYKKEILAGISFLANLSAQGGGKAYGEGGSMYSQGLAGIALSECYAMTQDNRLAAPTQAALNFIMEAQDPRGGGWRYGPKQPGDTSAVGWQLMALKSGHMAYLQVNPLTIKKAVEFLNSVQDDDGASYGYTDPGKAPGTTAVGLLCRMYLGWKKDHPALQRGLERLSQIGPTNDLYYDYYATQVMHHVEGDMWIAWNAKMKDLLIKTQAKKDHELGSWYEGVQGGHGPEAGGRIYCTSLATMILEVYYRHLPIYRNESVEAEFKE